MQMLLEENVWALQMFSKTGCQDADGRVVKAQTSLAFC